MTLIEAFTAGHLPEYGTFSLPLIIPGRSDSFYIDPQAYTGVWTKQ